MEGINSTTKDETVSFSQQTEKVAPNLYTQVTSTTIRPEGINSGSPKCTADVYKSNKFVNAFSRKAKTFSPSLFDIFQILVI